MTSPPSPQDNPEFRKLRHDLMGHLNSLRLTATLLPMLSRGEVMEYLPGIETAADSVVELLDRLEKYFPQDPGDVSR